MQYLTLIQKLKDRFFIMIRYESFFNLSLINQGNFKVFDENSTNSDVYSHIAGDIVKGVMTGINGTIFACKIILISFKIE
jgi:hypothetical protein